MPPLRTTDDCTDDRTTLLIADYLEADPTDPCGAVYRLRGSHLPAQYVAQQVTASDQDIRAAAQELGVYYRAVEAAVAYCAQHGNTFAPDAQEPTPRVITAAIDATTQAALPPQRTFPWWLQFLALICLGAASMTIGVALAVMIR